MAVSAPMDSLLDSERTEALPREQKVKLLDSLADVVAKGENDSVSRFNLVLVANQYFYINEIDKYRQVSQKLVEMSAQSNDTIALARGYHY